jgi:hypothetical protein
MFQKRDWGFRNNWAREPPLRESTHFASYWRRLTGNHERAYSRLHAGELPVLVPPPPAGSAPKPSPLPVGVACTTLSPPPASPPLLYSARKMAELDIGQHCQVEHCRQRGDTGVPISRPRETWLGSDARLGGGGWGEDAGPDGGLRRGAPCRRACVSQGAWVPLTALQPPTLATATLN